MALVVIKVRDEDDGSVNIVLESEPPIPNTSNTGQRKTGAQLVAIAMLDAVATPDDIIGSK